MSTHAVLLSAAANPQALAALATTLAQQHERLIVAIDGTAERAELAPLPQRWGAVRAQLAGVQGSFVTPLVATPALLSRADQCAALVARLGPIDALWVDAADWLTPARQLGLNVRLAPAAPRELVPPLAPCRRALVVTRAQPFHLGHRALVEHALTLADEVILVVAAAERALTARDPYSAGERLQLVRAGLAELSARVWLLALPAPTWPAMALAQLAFVAPPYELVVAHNPLLRALAAQQVTPVVGLAQPLSVAGQRLSASAIRARLASEGAGRWLYEQVPAATADLLIGLPTLAERCALIAAAG